MEITQSQAEMKEDWAKRLNDKMAGYEEPVPSAPAFIPRRRTPWWIISAAAAAVVAGVFLWPRSEKIPVETVSVQNEALPMAMTEEIPVEESVSEEALLPVKSVQTRFAREEVMVNEEPTVEDIPILQEMKEDETPKVQKNTSKEQPQVVADEWARFLAMEDLSSRKRPRVNLSVYAQTAPYGRSQTPTTDNSVNPVVNPADPPVDPVNPPVGPFPNHPNTDGSMGDPPGEDEDDNPDTRATALAPLENTMTLEEMAPWNHRFPLKVGLRVSAYMGNGFGVETGLSYLRFLSERSGKEQQLHYLGVPLRLRYDIWDVQSVSLYGSVGTEAMKCVAGNGPGRPWLFAAEAAAGLGWKLSQDVGLYAETGFGRYFHTGESKHYYTEHPFALSVTLGLRFDL